MITGSLQPLETWDAAAAVADRRLGLELDLIGSVLARPRDGVATCQRLGFDRESLSHDDLRLMYVAAEECCHRSKTILIRIIKRALCTSGHWDADARWYEREHKWSDVSLASLACSFPGAAHTEHAAKRLMQVDGAMRAASDHFKAGMKLLLEVA